MHNQSNKNILQYLYPIIFTVIMQVNFTQSKALDRQRNENKEQWINRKRLR